MPVYEISFSACVCVRVRVCVDVLFMHMCVYVHVCACVNVLIIDYESARGVSSVMSVSSQMLHLKSSMP